MYTPSKIRESIRAAASRKSEFRQKRSGKHDEEKIGLFWVMLRIWWVARYIFVNEHTSQFVTDLRAAEIILYRDLHDIALVDDALPLLHFDDDEDDALAQSLMD